MVNESEPNALEKIKEFAQGEFWGTEHRVGL